MESVVSAFLFGLILFFSVASVVMLLDGKKKPQGEGEAKVTSTGAAGFVPDAATLALAERLKKDPAEFARGRRQVLGQATPFAAAAGLGALASSFAGDQSDSGMSSQDWNEWNDRINQIMDELAVYGGSPNAPSIAATSSSPALYSTTIGEDSTGFSSFDSMSI
jgi:hypothetical protein